MTKQSPAIGAKQAVARNSAKRQAAKAPIQTRRTRSVNGKALLANVKRQAKSDKKRKARTFTKAEVITAIAITALGFALMYTTLGLIYLMSLHGLTA